METGYLLLVSALFAVAAYTDIRTRRIPNGLSLALALLGLLRLLLAGDAYSALWTIAAAACVLLVGFLLFWRRLFGGGDVKLMAAAALLVGWHGFSAFLFVMSLCGGLLSLGLVAAAKLRNRAPPEAPAADAASVTVPYGVAIAAAGVMILVLQSFPR